jgi:hypothetical protein
MHQAILKAAVSYWGGQMRADSRALKEWTGRGILPETLASFNVGYWPKAGGLVRHLQEAGFDTGEILAAGLGTDKNGRLRDKCFDVFALPVFVDGQIITIRFKVPRWRKQEGKGKGFSLSPGDVEGGHHSQGTHLLNSCILRPGLEYVIICEGEPDLFTLCQADFPAVAVPGAGIFKASWVKLFEGIESIYVALDPDRAGEKGFQNILERLGRPIHRVSVPGGDINDLQKGYSTPGDFKAAFQAILGAAKVHHPGGGQEQPWEIINPDGEEPAGAGDAPRFVNPASTGTPGPTSPALDLAGVFAQVGCPDAADVFIIEAPTGTGKTYFTQQNCIRLYEAKESITCLFPTKNEIRSFNQGLQTLLKSMGYTDEDITGIISVHTSETQGRQEAAPIALSTFAYLGFRGETPFLYSIAREILGGRFVFVDEAHALWAYCTINEYLAARYSLRGGWSLDEEEHYRRVKRCPLTNRPGRKRLDHQQGIFDGDDLELGDADKICGDCIRHFKRRTSDETYKKGYFAPEISRQENLAEAAPNFPPALSPFWEDDSTIPFVQIGENSNLHAAALEITPAFSLEGLYPEKAEGKRGGAGPDRKAYLEKLLQNLYEPNIKTEKPVPLGAEGNLRKYPVYPCQLPILSGIDTTPLLQLIPGTAWEDSPKGLVIMSATMPREMADLIKHIACKAGAVATRIINRDVPFTFDATLLQMTSALSTHLQTLIVKGIMESRPGTKFFIITATKGEAKDCYSKFKGLCPHEVTYFVEDSFEQDMRSPVREATGAITLTYSRSAITKAANMPEVCFVLVDCGQFIPQAALGGLLRPGVNVLEKQMKIIQDNLTQIIGRVFRSTLERKPGMTVQDHSRRIVILAHNIPEGLQVKLDPALMNPGEPLRYNEAQFVSRVDKSPIDSIVKGAALALDGKDIPDQEQADKVKLAERKIEQMSKAQRKRTAGERERDKAEAASVKARALEAKVRELAETGRNWKETYDRLHLERIPRYDRCLLREVHDEGMKRLQEKGLISYGGKTDSLKIAS